MKQPAEDMSDYFSVFLELKSLGVKVPKMKKFKSLIPKQARLVPSSSNKIFGTHLIEQEKIVIEDYPLPKFIVTSTDYLKKFIEKEIGLFRKAGSVSRQRDLRIKLEKGESIDDSEPNDIASLLKQWLRELPEPLIPNYLQDLFVRSMSLQSEDNRVSALLLCCHLLPFDNFCTLKYLINFLAYVTEHCDKNKMGARNLALIMAPNIFVMGTNTIDKSSNLVQQHTSVVELLINNAHKIGLPCTSLHLTEAEALKCSPDFDSSVDILDFSPTKSKKKRRSGPVQDLFTGFKKLVGQNSLSPSKRLHQDDCNSDTRSALKRKADPELLPSMSPLKKKAIASNSAQIEPCNSTPNKITQSIFGTKEKPGKAHSRRKSFGLLKRKEKKRQKSLKSNALDTVLTVSTPDPAQEKFVSTSLESSQNKENIFSSKTSPLLSAADIENLFSKSGFIKKSASDCYLTIHKQKSQDKQLFSVSSSEGCLGSENRFSPYNLRSNTIGKRVVKQRTELNNGVEPFMSSTEADKQTIQASFVPCVLKSSPVSKRRTSTPKALNVKNINSPFELKNINQSNSTPISEICNQRHSLEVPNIPIKRSISRLKNIHSSQDKDSVSAVEESKKDINVDKSDKDVNDSVPTITLTQSNEVSSSVSSANNNERVKRECSIKRQEAFMIKSRNSKKAALNQLKRADSIKISKSRTSRMNSQNGTLNEEKKSFQKLDFSTTDETVVNVQKNENNVLPNKKCLKRNARNGSIVRGRPNTVKTGLPSDVCSRYNNESSINTKHELLSSKTSVDNNVNHHETNDHDLSIIVQIQNITLLSPKEISVKIDESKCILSNGMHETMIPFDIPTEKSLADTTKENITCDLPEESHAIESNNVTDPGKSNKVNGIKESKIASKRKSRERLCSNSDSKVQNMKKKTRLRERTNSFPRSSAKVNPRKTQKLRAVKSSSPRKSLENNATASCKIEKENMCLDLQNQENANALKTPENAEAQQMWYDGRQFLGNEEFVQDDAYNKRESILSILKNNPGHVRSKASLYETRSTSSTPVMCNTVTPGGRVCDSRYSNTQNMYSQNKSTSTRSKKSMKRNSPLPPPPKFVIPDSPPSTSYPLKEVTNLSNTEEVFASPYPPSSNKLNISTSEDIFLTPPSTKKSLKTSIADEKSSERRNTRCSLKPKMKSFSGHTPFKLPVDKSKVVRSESSPLLQIAVKKASRNLYESVPQNKTEPHVSLQSNENSVSAPVYKTRSFISIEKLHHDQLLDEWNYEM